jgi:5-(hydroxymethyl)furfural/furfural oxidase
MECDIVVIGGGSAGCVLASRLSEDPGCRVVLIEAGADTPPGRVPEDVLDSNPMRAFFNPAYKWPDLKVYLQPVSHNSPDRPPLRAFDQARIMGGGSAINGQIAVRGHPDDYDGWAAAGAAGWNWDAVLPYFLKLERDLDFAGPLHGRQGPIPIRRVFPDNWPGYAQALSDSYGLVGLPLKLDANGDDFIGHFPVPISNAYDRRVTSAVGYLEPMVRARPNLTILSETEVEHLVFDGTRCIGVNVRGKAGTQVISARETVVSAGAIHSPALLMRSGVGPARQLAELGVSVVHDLPGVGQNLHEHPTTAISAYLEPDARMTGEGGRHILIQARFTSGHPGCPAGDMAISMGNRSGWHRLGWRLGTLQVWVNRSYSRGEVRLKSADWRTRPEVRVNLLSDVRDMERLKAGFRFIANVFRQQPLARLTRDPFPSAWSERVRKVGEINRANAVQTAILGKLMDGPAALRRFLVRTVITQGRTLETVMKDDETLEAYLRETVTGNWHVSGSCKMGADDDKMAVTDSAGRVRGVGGLRVADASIMPYVPRANTNIPTIMIAEKIADAIRAEARQSAGNLAGVS